MSVELYIITGATGTGKSTLIPILRKNLPTTFSFYDYDEILRPYDHSQTWADEVTEKMMQIASDNKKKNIITIFVGLIRPYLVKKYEKKYNIHSIQFCLLDITTEERKRRLAQRKSSMSPVGGIEEHEGFRKWIKESDYPYKVIDVTNLSPEKVVEQFISDYKLE